MEARPQQNPPSRKTLAKPVGSAFVTFLLLHVLPLTTWALGVSHTQGVPCVHPQPGSLLPTSRGGPKAHHPAGKDPLFPH